MKDCLELQRGQVNLGNNKKLKNIKEKGNRWLVNKQLTT